jgi:diacylglycerol kinase
MSTKAFDLVKFRKSFGHAWRGFVHLMDTEQNARIHLMITLLVALTAALFHITRLEAAILFFAVILVFAVEIMNTAIEKFLDIVHPDNHHQIRYVKDAMAGAVLITAFIAALVGILIFYPYLFAWIHAQATP